MFPLSKIRNDLAVREALCEGIVASIMIIMRFSNLKTPNQARNRRNDSVVEVVEGMLAAEAFASSGENEFGRTW